jgi:hypothetical protein
MRTRTSDALSRDCANKFARTQTDEKLIVFVLKVIFLSNCHESDRRYRNCVISVKKSKSRRMDLFWTFELLSVGNILDFGSEGRGLMCLKLPAPPAAPPLCAAAAGR